jgi:DNA-binding GntR family transcriptional regulator
MPPTATEARSSRSTSLVRHIFHDLESRIRQGRPLPTRLTLSSLADHYGVSFTPVREAVDDLVDRGYLIRTSSGRLRLNDQAPPDSTEELGEAPPQPVNWDDVLTRYALIESLRGKPTPLREEAISQQFGIGRTVLRQVFNRLAGAGLIDYLPRRGWRARPFREQDLRAYLDVRVTLERKALELAWPRLDDVELAAMLQGNLPSEGVDRPRVDNRLHQYFIQLAGNRYISDFFAHYGAYYRALFDYVTLGEHVIREKADQHCEILRCVLARDYHGAQSALEHHIREQEPVVLRMMARLESTDALPQT